MPVADIASAILYAAAWSVGRLPLRLQQAAGLAQHVAVQRRGDLRREPGRDQRDVPARDLRFARVSPAHRVAEARAGPLLQAQRQAPDAPRGGVQEAGGG